MGILLTPTDPADLLLSISQDHRPIEDYIEEFLELVNQIPWTDAALKAIFWSGLDDPLFRKIPAATTTCYLKRYSDNILWLCGSSYTVEEAVSDSPSVLVSACESSPVMTPTQRLTALPNPIVTKLPECEICPTM